MLAALLVRRKVTPVPVLDQAQATPGRVLRMRHVFRVESEADKLARRIAQGTVAQQQTDAVLPSTSADTQALAALHAATLQADIARAHAETERQRARVDELTRQAQQRAQQAEQRAERIDRLLAAELAEQQRLQLAYTQHLLVLAIAAEAEAQARIEEFDIAFIAMQMAEA